MIEGRTRRLPYRTRAGFPVMAGASVVALLWAGSPATAQQTAPAPAPGTSLPAGGSAALTAQPGLSAYNVLILTYDGSDLSTPVWVAPPQPVAGAAQPMGVGTGGAPALGNGGFAAGTILPAPAPAPVPAGPIAPASWDGSGGLPALRGPAQWTISAKKSQDPDDAEFQAVPDEGHVGATDTKPGAVTDIPRLGQPADQGGGTGADNAPPGLSKLTGLALRHDLLTAGFGDILPATPSDATTTRLVDDHHLTGRVLEMLRVALVNIAAATGTPAGADIAKGTLAAARVGQALGYRAVVVLTAGPSARDKTSPLQVAPFSILLVDTMRETGEPIAFDEKGQDQTGLTAAGAYTAAVLIEKSISTWPQIISAGEKQTLAQRHFDDAQNALLAGHQDVAQDDLDQTLALDPSRSDAYVLLGDLLTKSDPAAAAVAYERATQLDARDGETWAKIAIAYTTGSSPNWPRAIDAGRKALDTGYDSVALRTALATAQFGRADLFRKADKLDRAEDAEFEAKKHLDRALELAPDDPGAVRLLTRQMVEQGRYDEAVQTLDRIAPHYPNDLDIQSQYATALSFLDDRQEDAFITFARVWKLSGLQSVDVDEATYERLASGFDQRVFELGKTAAQLTTGVANAALPRESALLELSKLKEEMDDTEAAIKLMRLPEDTGNEATTGRIFAADLMNQSLDAHQAYLETGQEIYRTRALELNRQAVAQLNAVRAAK